MPDTKSVKVHSDDHERIKEISAQRGTSDGDVVTAMRLGFETLPKKRQDAAFDQARNLHPRSVRRVGRGNRKLAAVA
jgi:hypothetical protein